MCKSNATHRWPNSLLRTSASFPAAAAPSLRASILTAPRPAVSSACSAPGRAPKPCSVAAAAARAAPPPSAPAPVAPPRRSAPAPAVAPCRVSAAFARSAASPSALNRETSGTALPLAPRAPAPCSAVTAAARAASSASPLMGPRASGAALGPAGSARCGRLPGDTIPGAEGSTLVRPCKQSPVSRQQADTQVKALCRAGTSACSLVTARTPGRHIRAEP